MALTWLETHRSQGLAERPTGMRKGRLLLPCVLAAEQGASSPEQVAVLPTGGKII